jgi:hypothetical protein
MKLDLVPPIAARIEGPQFWRILVGDAAARSHRSRAPVLAELGQFLFRRRAAVGRDGVRQGPIHREQVDVLEGRRLVEYFMGGGAVPSRHGRISVPETIVLNQLNFLSFSLACSLPLSAAF